MDETKNKLALLFRAEKERFVSFVRRRLGDLSGGDAEDIVSDVVYRVLRRIDIVGEIENLTAYLYRSLENRIVDKRRGASPSVSLDEEALQIQRRPAQDRSPDKGIERLDLRERLAQAIGRLSPQERAVFLATEMDDRSFRDLAEEWGEPIGTLLSRKNRAVTRLQQMLAEYKDPN